MSYASTSDRKSDEKYREWELQPQNEYRFELAPNSSIGIKVRSHRDLQYTPADGLASISLWMGMLSVLEPSSLLG